MNERLKDRITRDESRDRKRICHLIISDTNRTRLSLLGVRVSDGADGLSICRCVLPISKQEYRH